MLWKKSGGNYSQTQENPNHSSHLFSSATKTIKLLLLYFLIVLQCPFLISQLGENPPAELFSTPTCPYNRQGSQGSSTALLLAQRLRPHHPRAALSTVFVSQLPQAAEELLGIFCSRQAAGRRTQVHGIPSPAFSPSISSQHQKAAPS